VKVIEVDGGKEIVRPAAVGGVCKMRAVLLLPKAVAGVGGSRGVGKGGLARGGRGKQRAVGGIVGSHARIGSHPKTRNDD
jgi:hypothetical protein